FEVCFTPNNGHSAAHARLPVLTQRRHSSPGKWLKSDAKFLIPLIASLFGEALLLAFICR
ncbi:MAG: hypothetical protein V3U60_02670, partial [Gammaproteobacteria bacterium]